MISWTTRSCAQHYQIWHFFYPAGLPILVSAQLFREKLEDLYNFFDPHSTVPSAPERRRHCAQHGWTSDEDGRVRQR